MTKRQMKEVSESLARGLQTVNGVAFFEGLPVAVYDVGDGIDAIVTDDVMENSKGEFERVLRLRKDGRVLFTAQITEDHLDEMVGVLVKGYGAKNNFAAFEKVQQQYLESAVRVYKRASNSLRRDIDQSLLTPE